MGSIGITNITITDKSGNPFIVGSIASGVKISFDVSYGQNNILAIKYSIWTRNLLQQKYYVDHSGGSRSHVFDLNLNYGSNLGDIIVVRIDIKDDKDKISTFYAEKMIPDPKMDGLTNPGISSISAFQRQDGSGIVDIYYRYQGLSSISASSVSAKISLDGSTYSDIASNALNGDVGNGVMPGFNRITWIPQVSFPSSYPSNIYLKLILLDADGRANVGLEKSFCVIDLDPPEVAIRKLSIEEEYDMLHSSSSSSLGYSSSSSSLSSTSSSSSSLSSSSSSSSSSEGYSSSSSFGYSTSSSSSSEGYSTSSSSSSEGYSTSSSSSSFGYSSSSSSEGYSTSSSSSSELYSTSSSSSSELYSTSSSSSSSSAYKIGDIWAKDFSCPTVNGNWYFLGLLNLPGYDGDGSSVYISEDRKNIIRNGYDEGGVRGYKIFINARFSPTISRPGYYDVLPEIGYGSDYYLNAPIGIASGTWEKLFFVTGHACAEGGGTTEEVVV